MTSDISRNHARKHDHTDKQDRCRNCGVFIPENVPQRYICANCGTPGFKYRPRQARGD